MSEFGNIKQPNRLFTNDIVTINDWFLFRRISVETKSCSFRQSFDQIVSIIRSKHKALI